MSRLDRFGERTDDDVGLWDDPAPAVPPVPVRRCMLCAGELLRENFSEVCAECRLVVANLFRTTVEERWRDLDGEHVVSDQGRVAKLLPVDRSHRYPRVNLGGERRYLRAVVAEAWHGPRPDGKQALHWDDDPDNPHASNIRWGTPAENAADAKRNRGSA